MTITGTNLSGVTSVTIGGASATLGTNTSTSIVVTTPNREYNELFAGMAPGAMRHADHLFEWDRAEFGAWSHAVAARHGYSVSFMPVYLLR